MPSLTDLSLQETEVEIIATVIVALLAFSLKRPRKKVMNAIVGSMRRRRDMRFGKRMHAEGVSNFYVGREDWIRHRRPPSLGEYLKQATKSVHIASYWMAQGTLEGIPRVCADLAEQGVTVEIAMIDPESVIPEALQFDLEIRPEAIRQQVREGLGRLQRLRDTLSTPGRDRFVIKVSRTLPQAAVILLDAGTADGKVQLEFRPYREPRTNSFSLELTAKNNARLYTVAERSWKTYFDDAVSVCQGATEPS